MDMANHSQRLQLSECYQLGKLNGEKLTCISCHNPHISVNQTGVEVYNMTCNQCHKKEDCLEEEQVLVKSEFNCVSCHMLATGSEDIPHVSVS